MLIEGIILLLSVVIVFYLFFTRKFNYWKQKGVFYLKPTLFFGNLGPAVLLKTTIGEQLAELYKKSSGNSVAGFFAFDKPALLIRDPELIKSVLIKDFNHFQNRVFSLDENNDPLAAKGLFSVNNPRWKYFRTRLNPAFTTVRVKMMFDMIDKCSEYSLNYMMQYIDKSVTVSAKTEAATVSLKTMIACSLGLEAKEQLPDNVSKFTDQAFPSSSLNALKMILLFFVPNITKILKIEIVHKTIYDSMRDLVKKLVEFREKEETPRNDYLELVTNIKKKSQTNNDVEPEIDLDDDDFLANAYLFLMGGFETSSNVLSFMIYEIIKNPDIQNRLRIEILESTNNGKEITYDSIKSMKYLDMIYSEVLRKYPPLPFLDRMCNENYTFPDTNISIEKGTAVYIPIMGLHNDPDYFEKPELFNPDRFSNENISDIKKMTYIPYGEGGRMCIGMKFGQIFVKTVIAKYFMNITAKFSSETEDKIKLDPLFFILNPTDNIDLFINFV